MADLKDVEMDNHPDVLADIPVIKVDKIDIEVNDLDARVAVLAKVRKLVNISVGAQAHLDEVQLKIEGVEGQALLKARLDNVSKILERVLLSLDRNPELLEGVGKALEEVGGGTGHLLDESGDAVEDVGEGAGKALPKVGEGASSALSDVGGGANQALGEVGEGANQALGEVGQGANQALGEVGQGAGQGVAAVGQGAQQGVGQLTGQQGQQQGQQQASSPPSNSRGNRRRASRGKPRSRSNLRSRGEASSGGEEDNVPLVQWRQPGSWQLESQPLRREPRQLQWAEGLAED